MRNKVMRFPSRILVRLWLPLTVISLALGGLLASCQPAAETETVAVAKADDTCPAPIKEAETMNSSEKETVALQQYGIPPIDAAAPSHTETATFSLG